MNNFEWLESSRPDIKVKSYFYPSHHFGGFCLDGDVYINDLLSNKEKYQWLQEEIAHHDYTVGDIVRENTSDKRHQEHLARSKAMEKTVPLDGLIYCYNHHIGEPQDIADHFGVTVRYLYEAINNYREKRGIYFTYHGYTFDLTSGLKLEKN